MVAVGFHRRSLAPLTDHGRLWNGLKLAGGHGGGAGAAIPMGAKPDTLPANVLWLFEWRSGYCALPLIMGASYHVFVDAHETFFSIFCDFDHISVGIHLVGAAPRGGRAFSYAC